MNALRRIVDGGFCIGCGACHAATGGAIPVALDPAGCFQAVPPPGDALPPAALDRALRACPFAPEGPHEDDLAAQAFPAAPGHDPRLGRFHALFIGHAAENGFRAQGTSGGVLSWTLAELLRAGRIDAVAHVRPTERPADDLLFRYALSRSPADIQAGAKSRYYPVDMSAVLADIRATPGRYALVGLPCFLKAARRLEALDPLLRERIIFHIGLVCGHLKSRAFADGFAWQAGIPPGQLAEIDFRVKRPGHSAGDYGVRLRGAGRDVLRPVRSFFGANWGFNFFRYPACDACDDVFAETADLAVGDAWLPGYEQDPLGTSIVVVRRPDLAALVDAACRDGRLALEPASADALAESQAGGLRDRREGLAYRLHLLRRRGAWAPRKRVPPSAALPPARARLYRARSAAGTASHRLWREAVARGDYNWFAARMKPFVRDIQDAPLPLPRRAFRRALRFLRTLRARLRPT